jgi:regulatory protein
VPVDGEAADPTATSRPRRPAATDTTERLLDPEVRLQSARDIAWRALNRRDRTVAEMREMLAGKRVEPATIDQVVAELGEGGYLDDERYARRFAEDRRRLDAWGAERIRQRLTVLGVSGDHIAAAVQAQARDDEMEAAMALLRRRFPAAPADERDRARALGILVRRGYDSDLAYEAVRRHVQGE